MSHYLCIEVISGPRDADEVRRILVEGFSGNWISLGGGLKSYACVSPGHEGDGYVAEVFTNALDDASVTRFEELFHELCRTTDWELRLDWDDMEQLGEEFARPYLYRPRGVGKPHEYDPDEAYDVA